MDSGEGLARQVGPLALWVLALVLSLANPYLQSRHLQPWRSALAVSPGGSSVTYSARAAAGNLYLSLLPLSLSSPPR
jgi:hypothetical protein